MEKLINSFEQHFKVKLQNPLKSPGKIQVKELLIKYILYKDTSGNTVLDFLIFDTTNGFPPLHKRINSEGVIQNLENFQFSIMFTTEVELKEMMLIFHFLLSRNFLIIS